MYEVPISAQKPKTTELGGHLSPWGCKKVQIFGQENGPPGGKLQSPRKKKRHPTSADGLMDLVDGFTGTAKVTLGENWSKVLPPNFRTVRGGAIRRLL